MKVALCQRGVRGQRTCSLAAGNNGLHRCLDGGLHLGVAGVAAVAHGGCQVGRTYEDAMHAVHGADGFEIFQGRGGLGLHQQADLVVGHIQIVGAAAPL